MHTMKMHSVHIFGGCKARRCGGCVVGRWIGYSVCIQCVGASWNSLHRGAVTVVRGGIVYIVAEEEEGWGFSYWECRRGRGGRGHKLTCPPHTSPSLARDDAAPSDHHLC